MVSHDLHVVMAASDRVLCLNGMSAAKARRDRIRSAEYALFGSGAKGRSRSTGTITTITTTITALL